MILPNRIRDLIMSKYREHQHDEITSLDQVSAVSGMVV